MNEEITPIEAVALPDYKDRSTGLTIFGILTILLGCLAGLVTLLTLLPTLMLKDTNKFK